MIDDDPLQARAALLIQFPAIGAVLSPQKPLYVLDQRWLRPGVLFPIPELLSSAVPEQSPGIVLASVEQGNEVIHEDTS